MKTRRHRVSINGWIGTLVFFLSWMGASRVAAEEDKSARYTHQKDIVYGYKDGMALILDVFTPSERLNGGGVLWVVSGGLHSGPEQVRDDELPRRMLALLDHGYVVFAAMHSSQPKYTLPEIQEDMPRAVRYIRHHAKRFGIAGDRMGAIGFSSGGQLTLQLATSAPGPRPAEEYPIERESSRLQAAIAYFPGTDLTNFGKKDALIVEHFLSVGYKANAPFEFQTWDDDREVFVRVESPKERRAIFAKCSPVSHVSADDPATLLIHGDRDELVPMQQSQLFVERMEKAGAHCKLIVAAGKGHGWGRPFDNELEQLVGWFDKHLVSQRPTSRSR